MSSDESDFYKFLGIYIFVFLAVIFIFSPRLTNFDFYLKHVNVIFNGQSHLITEHLTFHVNWEKFHYLFKNYYGNPKDVVGIICPTGFKSYEQEAKEGGYEVGCKSNGYIHPGDYKITITYNPKDVDFNYVKWVSFNNIPRVVKSYTSNGDVPFKSSWDGRPLVAFYPHIKLLDQLYMYFLVLFLNSGWVLLILSTAFMLFVYYTFGKDYNIPDIPSVSHNPPSDRPAYDVAILIRDPPDTNGIKSKIKDILSSIIMDAYLKGAITLKDKTLSIVGSFQDKDGNLIIKKDSPINKFPDKIKNILITLANLEDVKTIAPDTYKEIYENLKAYYSKFKVYDSTGDAIFLAGTFIFSFLAMIVLSFDIFPLVTNVMLASTIFYLTYILFGSAFLYFLLFPKHIFGRFKDRNIYREKLLWDAFGNLLRNESLLKKYGPKDKNMWGKWLAYAYAYGVPKKIINYIIDYSSNRYYTYVDAYNGYLSSGISYAQARSSSSYGGGSMGGGFSGGGSFGAR